LSDQGIADRLQGVFLPVTTPFDEVTGEVAPVAWRENLRRYAREPIDGLVLFGSTGEGELLDEDEKARLTAFARDVVPSSIVLMAGASANSTRGTIVAARAMAAEGAEVLLIHPPGYFGPYLSPAAMADHFRAVADASPVPVLIYHMPKYTGVTLDAGLMGELVRHPNVIGLKDSSGDLKRFASYTDSCPPGKRLFVGNGTLLFAALELGGVGGILAIADFVPARCAELLAAFRAGEKTRAGAMQETLAVVHKEIVAKHGPVGVKAAMDLLGWTGGPPRAPLQALDAKAKAEVRRVLREAGVSLASAVEA
jgi:4-hydroxy-2-oxoglutarate aldolase